MKTLHWAMTLAAATTLLVSTHAFAAETPGDAKSSTTEKSVAFRTTANKTYVTAASKGSLNTKGAAIAVNQIFVLVDLNGGELIDGDSVQIKWAANTKPTYWRESEGSIGRFGGKPTDDSNFNIHLQAKDTKDAPQSIVLQTASGKFVSAPEKGAALTTTEKQDGAVTLEIVENPAPKAIE